MHINSLAWANEYQLKCKKGRFTHYPEKTHLFALELIFISSSWRVCMHVKSPWWDTNRRNKGKEKYSYHLVPLPVEGSRCLVVGPFNAMHFRRGKRHSQLCRRIQWHILHMPKKQTCIRFTVAQMKTAELRYECIKYSFVIDECWIAEFFHGLHS